MCSVRKPRMHSTNYYQIGTTVPDEPVGWTRYHYYRGACKAPRVVPGPNDVQSRPVPNHDRQESSDEFFPFT